MVLQELKEFELSKDYLDSTFSIHQLTKNLNTNTSHLSFIIDENKLKKVTHRVTLSSFEIQLKEVSSLVRCHRSYMVNLNKVKNISGNAQGLKLELINHSEIIPVSRKYIPIVKEFFQKNS